MEITNLHKKRAFINIGLDIGQVMLLDDSLRGIGKSEIIATKALLNGATVICQNQTQARMLMCKWPNLKAIGSKGVCFRGMRGSFYVDDISESQYKKIETQILKQNILGGVIHKDYGDKSLKVHNNQNTPMLTLSKETPITIDFDKLSKSEILYMVSKEAIK